MAVWQTMTLAALLREGNESEAGRTDHTGSPASDGVPPTETGEGADGR
jgi:hypothetical protein